MEIIDYKKVYPGLNAKVIREKVCFDGQIAYIVNSVLAALNERLQSMDQLGINAGSTTYNMTLNRDRFNKKSLLKEFYEIVIDEIKTELTRREFSVDVFYTVDNTDDPDEPATFDAFNAAFDYWVKKGGLNYPVGDFYPAYLTVTFTINWIDTLESIRKKNVV